jgi:hypothetical protein
MGFTIASQFLVFFRSKIDTFCWVGTPSTEKVQCFELFFSEERQKEKDILFCMVFLFWVTQAMHVQESHVVFSL